MEGLKNIFIITFSWGCDVIAFIIMLIFLGIIFLIEKLFLLFGKIIKNINKLPGEKIFGLLGLLLIFIGIILNIIQLFF